MPEEETVPKGEGTPDSTDTSGKPVAKPVNSVDRANVAIDRMKAENDRTEKLLERQEALRAEEILSGKADAGAAPTPPPKEETDKEYTERVLRGEFNEEKTKS